MIDTVTGNTGVVIWPHTIAASDVGSNFVGGIAAIPMSRRDTMVLEITKTLLLRPDAKIFNPDEIAEMAVKQADELLRRLI